MLPEGAFYGVMTVFLAIFAPIYLDDVRCTYRQGEKELAAFMMVHLVILICLAFYGWETRGLL